MQELVLRRLPDGEVGGARHLDQAGGQWNTYEIRAEGARLMVTLNGTQTVDMEDSTYADGPIALQYGLGVVKFRNVRIREL